MSVNKVILVGRLIKDPELKTVGDTTVTEFTIATNERFTTKSGEKKEETEFHSIVYWGKAGEVINSYVKKGDEIYIEGKTKTRTWDNDQGVTQYKKEVIASTFSFIGNKAKTEGQAPQGQTPQIGDDLPF